MRTLIAGGRDITDEAIAACPWKVSFIVTDSLAMSQWASEHRIPSLTYGPDTAHLMLDDAEALLVIGSSPLEQEARKRGLKIHIFRVDLQHEVADTDWI